VAELPSPREEGLSEAGRFEANYKVNQAAVDEAPSHETTFALDVVEYRGCYRRPGEGSFGCRMGFENSRSGRDFALERRGSVDYPPSVATPYAM
jgi:hypothetical protein